MMRECFSTIHDPRQTSKVLHNFVETIIIVVCATIAGCDVWEDIADFCRVKEEWFKEKLHLKLENGIPSHDTMQRIFQLMKPAEFEEGFTKWVSEAVGEKTRQTISVDGKTVRRSKGKGKKPIHMVSAWANEARMVLGQTAVEEKSNEITAVPELLELLDIEGMIVTADAMSCQKEIVKTINKNGADFVISLKENQPTMCHETKEYFDRYIEAPMLYSVTKLDPIIDCGHGRLEKRQYYLTNDPDVVKMYPEWEGLRGFGMMQSEVTVKDEDGNDVTTKETHFYITSLTNINEFAHAARDHWGVESSLHWCLDMPFHEDFSRTRKDHSAENFAVVRHIALNVLKNMNDKMSVARRRRHCAYDDAYLEKVLLSIHA